MVSPMELTSVASPALWAGFLVFVLAMLALDLGVFHKKSHVVGFREAAAWSAVWIALACAFGGVVLWQFGPGLATEFFTGYLIEKSLSVDNIFVFVVIFAAFQVPAMHQHRVLFWGVLGALVMRAVMIFAGGALLARFHWLIYVFGAFLVLTGVKLLRQQGKEPDLEKSWFMRAVRAVIPATDKHDGEKFFTRENGKRLATPLFMALVLVELTDLVFALDSIPAIFAITRDPFIVFTSNIFAILGLRSLYFLLAGVMDRFVYLKTGLAAVLVFVGLKMALIDVIKLPAMVSLL
ncbi:MAG: TerC family protein, partial [Myxococcales bacterium]|nr:TerC family protein [Myxococcales bacterium]